MEMGFEEKDVMDALRVTRNDGNAAVSEDLIVDLMSGDKNYTRPLVITSEI